MMTPELWSWYFMVVSFPQATPWPSLACHYDWGLLKGKTSVFRCFSLALRFFPHILDWLDSLQVNYPFQSHKAQLKKKRKKSCVDRKLWWACTHAQTCLSLQCLHMINLLWVWHKLPSCLMCVILYISWPNNLFCVKRYRYRK